MAQVGAAGRVNDKKCKMKSSDMKSSTRVARAGRIKFSWQARPRSARILHHQERPLLTLASEAGAHLQWQFATSVGVRQFSPLATLGPAAGTNFNLFVFREQ